MDKIILKNLVFYAYHGVLSEENKLGQKFILDVTLLCDIKKAGFLDDVNYTINYAEVYSIIKDIVETNKFNLIETIAETCAQEILSSFIRVDEVIIKVKKPQAPIEGIYDYFAIEIRRKKNA